VSHEKLKINREVHEFHGIHWEPNHDRFAVHTKSKREVAEGKRDYQVASTCESIDIYQCMHDPDSGFSVRSLGQHPSEKIIDCCWSPSGEMFGICEKDGLLSSAKQLWSIFIIVTKMEEKKAALAADNYIKFKGKLMATVKSE